MANFEAFRRTKKLISNLFFLKSVVVVYLNKTSSLHLNKNSAIIVVDETCKSSSSSHGARKWKKSTKNRNVNEF